MECASWMRRLTVQAVVIAYEEEPVPEILGNLNIVNPATNTSASS
jgi:hypothetical protein